MTQRLSLNPARPKAVVFDLDGTLLRHTTVSLYLSEYFGDPGAIRGLEQEFAAGSISNRRFAEVSAAWFAGHHVARVWNYLVDAPWIAGMDQTFASLRAADMRIALGTVTWRFAGEMLRLKYGLDACSGTEMSERNGVLSGEVSRYFNEFDKLEFVEKWAHRHDVSLAHVAAVGDARSDIPLFRSVGLSIALNATEEARAEADVCVDADDLRSVLPLLLGRSALHARFVK